MTIGSKQFSLFPEGFDQSRTPAHPPQRLARRPAQLGKVLGAKIGQLVLLAVAPDVFDGIELRRVGRQKLQLHGPALLGDKLPHQSAAVNGQPIPNDRQATTEVPLQMVQELDDLGRLDAAGKKPEIKVPYRDPGHSRQALPIEGILQHRRLATWSPSANPVRSLAQTAFVHKHYGSMLLERFFFISGQRTRFQRWIAGSSRWVARPTGRWQLQPKERSIFHTCPG